VIIIKHHRDEKKEGEGEPFFLAMEDSQSHIYISSGNLIIRQVKYLLPTIIPYILYCTTCNKNLSTTIKIYLLSIQYMREPLRLKGGIFARLIIKDGW
jgi:hypothetical protein